MKRGTLNMAGPEVDSGTIPTLPSETSLTIRLVFKSALRQTEGFLNSLIEIMGLDITAPNFSTLSLRGKSIVVPPLKRESDGAVNVLVDSTGLKIPGDGEWSALKHGLKRCRRWRKLHLGVNDGDLEIPTSTLTPDDVGDASQVPELLDQIEDDIESFTADGSMCGALRTVFQAHIRYMDQKYGLCEDSFGMTATRRTCL